MTNGSETNTSTALSADENVAALTAEQRIEMSEKILAATSHKGGSPAKGAQRMSAQFGSESALGRARKSAIAYLEKSVEASDLEPREGELPEHFERAKADIVDGRLKATVEDALTGPNLRLGGYVSRDALKGVHLCSRWMGQTPAENLRAFKESTFLFDIPLNAPRYNEALSARVRHCISSSDIQSLGQLLMHSEWDLTRSRWGRKEINQLKDYLVRSGLHLGMTPEELLTFEKNPPSTFLAAYPEIDQWLVYSRSEPVAIGQGYEGNDTPVQRNGHLVLPGTTFQFASSREAERFATAATRIFKKAGGEKDESYAWSIARLGAEESHGRKSYLLHLSDAALKVLSEDTVLEQFRAAHADIPAASQMDRLI